MNMRRLTQRFLIPNGRIRSRTNPKICIWKPKIHSKRFANRYSINVFTDICGLHNSSYGQVPFARNPSRKMNWCWGIVREAYAHSLTCILRIREYYWNVPTASTRLYEISLWFWLSYRIFIHWRTWINISQQEIDLQIKIVIIILK